MSNEIMDFSNYDICEIPVLFPKAVSDKKFILKQADGNAEIAHRRVMLNSAKLGPDGKPTQLGESLTDLAPVLISLCLFEEGKNTSVGLIFAKKLPSPILNDLYKKCCEISGIIKNEDKVTKEEKIAKLEKELERLKSLDEESKKD